MKYYLVLGTMYSDNDNTKLIHIKSSFFSSKKQIIASDGTLQLQTNILNFVPDVRSHEYVLTDMHENRIAIATPDYAKQENPDTHKYPINRAPLVDHAKLLICNKEFNLVRMCVNCYEVYDLSSQAVVKIYRSKATWKWLIDAEAEFVPAVLCGIFVFCKYLEKENELIVI